MQNNITIYQTNLDKEKALDLLLMFFNENKFSVELLDDVTISAEKGNRWLNAITFNPLSWRSTHTIKIQVTQVRIESIIDNSFQMVTASEERVWSEFFKEIETVLSTGKMSGKLKSARKKNIKNNIKFFGYLLAGMIIGGGLASGIARINLWFEHLIEPIVYLGAIIGVALFFYSKKKSEDTLIKELVEEELKKQRQKK